jgi:hypothetical protein
VQATRSVCHCSRAARKREPTTSTAQLHSVGVVSAAVVRLELGAVCRHHLLKDSQTLLEPLLVVFSHLRANHVVESDELRLLVRVRLCVDRFDERLLFVRATGEGLCGLACVDTADLSDEIVEIVPALGAVQSACKESWISRSNKVRSTDGCARCVCEKELLTDTAMFSRSVLRTSTAERRTGWHNRRFLETPRVSAHLRVLLLGQTLVRF